jgi:hypothetical protein
MAAGESNALRTEKLIGTGVRLPGAQLVIPEGNLLLLPQLPCHIACPVDCESAGQQQILSGNNNQ